MTLSIPTYDNVEQAAQRIHGHANHTPLLTSDRLDALTGANILLKPECLQLTGSFKFRGAYNTLSSLSSEDRARGIIAASSGNHAQGVAEAARLFGVAATILMPDDAPAIKIERTRRSGAEVVFYNRATGDREQSLVDLVEERGGVMVHPYNHFEVIAGQGTVGREIALDALKAGKSIDRLLVCTGGGGLTAGVTLAIKHHFPEAKIHGVEPEGFDDYKRSLEAGNIIANEQTAGSICDAILTPAPGEIGFEISRDVLDKVLVISDEEALAAVRFAYNELKLVVEPGGAAALAGLLQAGEIWQGETIAIVISGGNVDPDLFARIIS
ncbi:MAG: threonine/serine dehydratase [Pseudomonadota bacterium]